MQIWLTIFVSWPAPEGPRQAAGARKAHDHGLDAGEGVGVAAAHDGEHAVLRARLAARDRRVDEGDAAIPAAFA